MMTKTILFIFAYIIWGLLNYPVSRQDLAAGAFVSAFTVYLTEGLFSRNIGGLFDIRRYLWALYYIMVFLWECLKANVDVARRVVHPGLPIRPAVVRIKTNLKTEIALTFLANSITLTPGTTAVDIDTTKGTVYVHLLYMRDDYDAASMTLPLAERFESILKRIFE